MTIYLVTEMLGFSASALSSSVDICHYCYKNTMKTGKVNIEDGEITCDIVLNIFFENVILKHENFFNFRIRKKES